MLVDIAQLQVLVNESWNGTSWTEVTDINTARASLGAAGSQTAALAFRWRSTIYTANTRILEWNYLDRINRFKYS
jgi:hypothetical protein